MIGKDEVREAQTIMTKYRADNAPLYQRIIDNEKWFNFRHYSGGNPEDVQVHSAWLQNCLMHKHADAMDNYPEPVFLPREESDIDAAKELTAIVPVILEQNGYDDTYDMNWWYKLKMGGNITGVFWEKSKLNGIGDIEIKKIDILNCAWEAGLNDIQDSPNFFLTELISKDDAQLFYGDIDFGDTPFTQKYVVDENIDTLDKVMVVDWYYKKKQKDGTSILHYCKYIGDHIIFSSENENSDVPYYDHNLYPFVFDVMFPREASAVGYGYIDLMKDTQKYIDKMQQAVLKNAIANSRKRYFVSENANFSIDEFSNNEVEIVRVAGQVNDDKIREITGRPLDGVYLEVLNNKIQELKETAGNRDFQQGGVANGVTAASAIAALQEAGSKLSRDMIKSSYRAFNKILFLVVELIRQFYDAPRKFRITNPNGSSDFISYDNRGLKPVVADEFGDEVTRLPVFDIKIKAQKSNPFSQASMNEEAKEMFARGMFNPQLADQTIIALQMMDFEGKDRVMEMVSQNGTLLQQVQQMQMQMQQMAQIIQQLQGTDLSGSIQGAAGEIMNQGRPNNLSERETATSQVERAHNFAHRDRIESARAQSVGTTAVK